MLSPEEIEAMSEALIRIYIKIEDDLLHNVASRFSVLDEIAPETVAKWQINKLMELGALRRRNVQVIAKHSGKTVQAVENILKKAGYKALEYDEKIYQMALSDGLLPYSPVPVAASPALQQLIQGAIDNTRTYLNMVNTTALQSAERGFLDIVNQVYLETSYGITDYNTAMRKAVRQLADRGITGADYVSASGKRTRNHIDVAVRRCIVTSTAQTAGKMQEQRADEWGSNLVEVSSHLDARPSHAVWQGQVYMLHGSSDKYRNLQEATGYGTVTGLMGANCRHVFYPFIEGLSEQKYKPYDLEESAKAYEKSQEQRKFERDIRQQKRRILAADAVDDKEGKLAAQLKLKEKGAGLKQFIKDTGRTQRTNRQQVVGFGHSQAMQAVWAQKKVIKSYAAAHKASTYNVLPDIASSGIMDGQYRFDSRIEADKFFRPWTEETWPKLTKAEKEAAYRYTQGSGKFNRPMRGYNSSWNDSAFEGIGNVSLDNEGAGKMISDLEKAISQSEIKENVWLFRGSDQQSLAKLLGVDKSKIVPSNVVALNRKFAGTDFSDHAFFSTGIAADAGFRNTISYEIFVPKGAKGIYAEPFSAFGRTNTDGTWDGKQRTSNVSPEAEMILQAGTRFRIKEIKTIGQQLTAILEVIK